MIFLKSECVNCVWLQTSCKNEIQKSEHHNSEFRTFKNHNSDFRNSESEFEIQISELWHSYFWILVLVFMSFGVTYFVFVVVVCCFLFEVAPVLVELCWRWAAGRVFRATGCVCRIGSGQSRRHMSLQRLWILFVWPSTVHLRCSVPPLIWVGLTSHRCNRGSPASVRRQLASATGT